jgi:FMN phosphatase YigB (HAD superfamily)
MWAEWLQVPDYVLFAALGAVIERGEHHHRVFELLRPGFDLETALAQRREEGIPDEFDAADLYPDVAGCLEALYERGLRIGIAGNQPAGVERVFQTLSLRLDFVASSTQCRIEKPSPGRLCRRPARQRHPSCPSVRHDRSVHPARSLGIRARPAALDGLTHSV